MPLIKSLVGKLFKQPEPLLALGLDLILEYRIALTAGPSAISIESDNPLASLLRPVRTLAVGVTT